MGWRVLTLARYFNITPKAKAYLQENECEIVENKYGSNLNDAKISEEEVIRLLEGVDACIVAQTPITRKVIEASKNLKVISKRGVGVDNIDMEAASEHGILVTVVPGAVENAVADYVFALLLAVSRKVVEGHLDVLNHAWTPRLGVELWRKSIGIVGLGRIGQAVAMRARGFNMKILAYDLHEDREFSEKNGVEYVSLDYLMEESDFVSINAPLTKQTHHLITEEYLKKMKPSGILINTSRGGLIDEEALIRVLNTNSIGGAGLDVFESEPLVESPLLKMKNVVLTPHTGGYTLESVNHDNLIAASNIVSIMKGKEPDKGMILNRESVV